METKLVIYRESKNNLISLTMPKYNTVELYHNGKTIFNGVEYLKSNTISITKERGHQLTTEKIKVIRSQFDGRINCAISEFGTNHQPNYLGYDGRRLSDVEFIQILDLRFGYDIQD